MKKSKRPDSNKKIKILTQHHLGPKKSLAIIRVAGESLLIGVTDHSINLIKPLSLLDEEVPLETSSQFSVSLGNATGSPNEDFSVKGIKDIVANRLKGMKEL